MNYIYSAINNAFYPLALKESYQASYAWPDDCVEVDESVFAEFTGNPPVGKILGANEIGYPAWVDAPPPSKTQIIEQAEAEKLQRVYQANLFINSKQWPGKAAIGRLTGEELSQYNLWLDYLDALDAIDTSTAPDITWPEQPQ